MIRPTDFIDLAARLAARPQVNEAELRTAIGRAYYGAAHLARQTIAAVGVKLQVSLHELHRYLSNSGHDSACRAGDALGRLQTHRIRADYHLDQPLARHGGEPIALARMCVELAKDIETLLGACMQSPAKEQICAGIAEFLKRDPKHRTPTSPN